ncbi:uncharacterized protein BX663DRAFT_503364 [Cokeromyces recurvatus]|uniref:uncharacterized protein n=1 Tax=Cokeromyces recurvatus TaxID=90255 RepID=UPI00222054F6|nr:uncharacterized protein BX663DRAFT_503364 [Cokeromyces recurvatus]KAI7904733.1 hypothetical protein BX663DRAFT_503364 [Cokeromyces recurvatus]
MSAVTATPLLSRQNAFLLEENDMLNNSLHFKICVECKQRQTQNNKENKRIQPCHCLNKQPNNTIYVYIECFKKWLRRNDCKSNYYYSIVSSCKTVFIYAILYSIKTMIQLHLYLFTV